MEAQKRVERALEIARSGGVDGSHHKMWTIDQMVRALTGCSQVERQGVSYKGEQYTFRTMGENQEYLAWVREYQAGEDGPLTYEWDTGIAP